METDIRPDGEKEIKKRNRRRIGRRILRHARWYLSQYERVSGSIADNRREVLKHAIALLYNTEMSV